MEGDSVMRGYAAPALTAAILIGLTIAVAYYLNNVYALYLTR